MGYSATGAEGCKEVLPLAERLLLQYGSQIADKSTMAKMVGTNAAYSMAKVPYIRTKLGVMPNPTHRVVCDDIGWGLCVLVAQIPDAPKRKSREVIDAAEKDVHLGNP